MLTVYEIIVKICYPNFTNICKDNTKARKTINYVLLIFMPQAKIVRFTNFSGKSREVNSDSCCFMLHSVSLV